MNKRPAIETAVCCNFDFSHEYPGMEAVKSSFMHKSTTELTTAPPKDTL